MRLAVFTNMHPGLTGTFFARDMRALIECGADVHIFSLYPVNPGYWSYVPEILSEQVLPRDRTHHLPVRQALRARNPARVVRTRGFLGDAAAILGAGVSCGPVAFAKTIYTVPLAWTWAQQFRDRFDHILAYWGGYPASCAYFFHRFTESDAPVSMFLHSRTDVYGRQPLLRRKLLYADVIVSISEYNRRFLAERYADIFERIAHKIHVNYRGLDFRSFPFEPEGRLPRRVLAVGRLHKEKGYDYLLRAAAMLLRFGTDIELEIIGDGPERKALQALAKRLGIADKVQFPGWLKFDAVRTAMLRATILANPSREDALPTVVEEAMALGLPVVASRVQGVPELLDEGRCGVLVSAGDVGALADAIATLITDPALRRGYAERARRHAERMLDMWTNGARLADRLWSARRGEAPARSWAIGEQPTG